jgi:hypothetical protein
MNGEREELLTAKELAGKLKRAVTYVYAMRKAGFEMPGKRSTVGDAIAFLRRCPEPRKRREQRG